MTHVAILLINSLDGVDLNVQDEVCLDLPLEMTTTAVCLCLCSGEIHLSMWQSRTR
jgi:alpha-D-ribose 1-methylphosphonate 5-triphosphate synthase subunit PhnH